MDDYLRSVRSALGAGGLEAGSGIHIVLGGPEADVDTVASTLSLALHLSQKDPQGPCFCVPVLPGGGVAVLPGETVEYLQRVEVRESSLVWREDVDLMELHHSGSLSLTLLRDDTLNSCECSMLASSVVRTVHRRGQRDAGQEEGASSAATTVTREILQEAAERVQGVLGEALGEALRLQKESLWLQTGRRSAHLEDLANSLEKWRAVPAVQHTSADGKLHDKDIEQQLTQMLSEFTDGEFTLALTSMVTDSQDWYGYLDMLKSFCHLHNYDSLVVVKYAVQPPHPQVVVYSDNTNILNQICCELEESSICSQSGVLEAGEFIQGCLQVYHLPGDILSTPELEEGLHNHLKAFVERNSAMLACHPSSRTSSTEGVAGSVEFSQGSSGITDMYGSDTERTCADEVSMAGEMADREGDSGGAGVGGGGGELVSPDSGMATIRSSRSSKESSVFLSDDSPIGEMMAGAVATAGPGGLFLRNPSPLGFSSLSTPVPPERRKQRRSRNRSDNLDLFSFDPLHNSNSSLPVEVSLEHLGVTGVASRAGRSSLSEFEELSLVDFSAPKFVSGSENAPSSAHHPKLYCGDICETEVSPTPVNSLAGSCQPSHCSDSFIQEGTDKRITGLQPKQSLSSLSEVWEEFGFNSTVEHNMDDNIISNVNNVGETEGVRNILEENGVKGLSKNKVEVLISKYKEDKILKPQLSLITDADNTWNLDSGFTQSLDTSTLADLQLTPPIEDIDRTFWTSIAGVQEKLSSVARKRECSSTLTPESSKEDDDGMHRRKGERQTELQDFWSYSAEKGFIKSDSGATTSYPESLDMWNTTICDDGLSPLTTPDIENLPECSDSISGQVSSVEGVALIESPLGYSEYGMVMWNTTIQEDSSSSVTSPDGPEMGKDSGLSQDASRCAPGTHMNQQVQNQKHVDQEKHTNTLVAEEGVKIIIEEVGGGGNGQVSHIWSGPDEQDMTAGDQQNSSNQNLESWAIPVPKMVTSTSEYDNIGASAWSTSSSPETHASPGTHMIQLDGESSPFIALVKPKESQKADEQCQQSAQFHRHYCSEGSEENQSQVFLFEEPNELDSIGSTIQSENVNKGEDFLKKTSNGFDQDQSTVHSPFILVNDSPLGTSSASFNLSPEDAQAMAQMYTHQVVSLNKDNWENLPTTAESYKSTYNSDFSLDLKTTVAHVDDVSVTERNCDPHVEARENVEGAVVDTVSLSPSSGGERDGLRCSHDSLLLSSRDELRSNSDGDSSSGLEMESIVVSGSVTESKGGQSNGFCRAWQSGSAKPVGDAERSMETFSMLSCAATLLKAQESRKQSRQKQTITENDSLGSVSGAALLLQPLRARPSQSDLSDAVLLNKSSHDKHTTNKPSSKEGNYFHECAAELTTDICRSTQPFTSTRHCPTIIDNTSEDSIVPEIIGSNITKTPPEVLLEQDSTAACHILMQAAEANADYQSNIVVRSMSSSLRHPSDHFLKTREEIYVHSQISMEDSDDGMQSPSAPPYCPPLLGRVLGWEEESAEKHMPPTTSEPPSPELTHSSFSHNSSYIGTPVSESGHLAERTWVGSPFAGDLMEEVGDEEDKEDVSLERPVSSFLTKGQGKEREGGGHIQMPCTGLTEDLMGGECTAQLLVVQTMESTKGGTSQSREDSSTEQPITFHYLDESANQEIGGGSTYSPSQSWSPTTVNEYSSRSSRSSLTRHMDVTEAFALPPCETILYQWTRDASSTECQAQYGYNYHHTDQRTDNQNNQHHDPDSSVDQRQEEEFGCEPRQQLHPPAPDHQVDGHGQYVPGGYDRFLLTRTSEQGDYAASTQRMEKEHCNQDDEGDNQEGSNHRRKLSLDHSEGSLTSDDAIGSTDDSVETSSAPQLNTGGTEAGAQEAIPEYSAAEERRDSTLWRSVVIGEQEHRVDMKCIEPYRRVVSHGGYYGDQNAIIVFAACFLPDSNCENYNYVMENLFLYVISTLELMVAEDYMIVYLNGATPRRRMPGFSWMKKCYQMIDRRLKKNLKLFIIVHPSWFIRTVLGLTRPFISYKFSSKIKYVHSLAELWRMVPMEYVHIPASIVKLDEELQQSADKDRKRGNSAV